MKLTQQMIDVLRKEFGKIDKVDPSKPSYKKIVALLDTLSLEDLQALVDAKIKFISSLALNRVMRKEREASGQFKTNKTPDTSALAPLKALMVEQASSVSDIEKRLAQVKRDLQLAEERYDKNKAKGVKSKNAATKVTQLNAMVISLEEQLRNAKWREAQNDKAATETAGTLEIKTAEARLQKAQYAVEKAKRHGGQPSKAQMLALNTAKTALSDAINKASHMDTNLAALKTLMIDASEEEVVTPEIAPSGVLLATTVEKARHGDALTTFELAPLVKRLAFSDLSQEEIAKRFTKAFSDVLFTAA